MVLIIIVIISIIAIIELLKYFQIIDVLLKLKTISGSAMSMVFSKEISDEKKEKIIFAQALDLLKLSIKIIFKFLIIFIIVGSAAYLAGFFLLKNPYEIIKVLYKLEFQIGILLFGGSYLFLRNRCFNKK